LEVYAQPPTAVRARRRAHSTGAGTINLRLAYRAPLHAPALLEFLAHRAVSGVEEVDGRGYRRALHLPHGRATVELTPAARWVAATLRLDDVRDLAPAVARCRLLFDLDADPIAVDTTLSGDPALAGAVAAEPGVRVPRAADGFELAVRAIVGQQVSVAAARTTLGRLVPAAAPVAPDRIGDVDAAGPDSTTGPDESRSPRGAGRLEPTVPRGSAGDRHRAAGFDGTELVGFPTAEVVAKLPDDAFGMPAARRATIRALAGAIVAGDLDLEPGADRERTVARLLELPGVGEWTAGYVAMRAIGDPDVFLPTDLGVRRGALALGLPDSPGALAEHAQRWRPWRSYASIRLWRAA
jgi:AraC family transcriptional regulator of adaptative response / DNA-3-methyladenine glycosylase II